MGRKRNKDVIFEGMSDDRKFRLKKKKRTNGRKDSRDWTDAVFEKLKGEKKNEKLH